LGDGDGEAALFGESVPFERKRPHCSLPARSIADDRPPALRDRYVAALEAASVDQNIGPFTDLLASLVARPGELAR
jgi:hypothetical protein